MTEEHIPFCLSLEPPRKNSLDSHSLTSKARVHFVCLRSEVSPVAFRFDLVSAVEDGLGVDSEAVFVVPAPVRDANLVSPLDELKNVEVGEVVWILFCVVRESITRSYQVLIRFERADIAPHSSRDARVSNRT